MHILVTDDGYKAALGIVRSLGRRGLTVSVLADSPVSLASHSRYCRARYLVPSPQHRDFLPSLLGLLQQVHFDLVIPVSYAMTSAMAQHKTEIQALTHLEVAEFQHVQAAADKHAMRELAASLSVPVPRTYAPSSPADAIALAAGLQLPIVIKFPYEAPGTPVWYAGTRVEVAPFYRAACAMRGPDRPLPLIQEFVPGFGAGFFAVYQHGVCQRVFMHKRIREVPPSGGMSCCAESFFDSRLEDYGRRLLDKLQWHGAAMVEFRYDRRDDEYKLMEINPKFWGSLDLALAAGVDFPWFLCQIAQGRLLGFCDDYNRSLRYHWPLLEVQHALAKPSSWLPMMIDSLRPEVRSNLWWSDPLPNLLEPFERARSKLQGPAPGPVITNDARNRGQRLPLGFKR